MDSQSLSSILPSTYDSMTSYTDPSVVMTLNDMDDSKLFISHSPPSIQSTTLAPSLLQQAPPSALPLHPYNEQQLLANPSASSSPISRISNHPSPSSLATTSTQAAIPTPNIHDTGFLPGAPSAAGSSSSPRSHSTSSNPPSANSSAVIPLNNILPTRTGKQVTIGAVVDSLFENVINTAVSARQAYHRGENNEIHVQLEEMIESLKLVTGLGFGPKIRTIDLPRPDSEVDADSVNSNVGPSELTNNGTPSSSTSVSATAPAASSARQALMNSAPVGSAASASGLLGITPNSNIGATSSRNSLGGTNSGTPSRHGHSHSLSNPTSTSNSPHSSMSPPQSMSRPLPLPLSALTSVPTSTPSPPMSAAVTSASMGMVGAPSGFSATGAPTLMASPTLDFDLKMTPAQLNAASVAASSSHPPSYNDPARKRLTHMAPTEEEGDNNARAGKFMKMSPPASGSLVDEIHGGSSASAQSTPSPGGPISSAMPPQSAILPSTMVPSPPMMMQSHPYPATAVAPAGSLPISSNMNMNMNGSPSMHMSNGTMVSSTTVRQLGNRSSGVWDTTSVAVSGVAAGGGVVIPPPQMERQFSNELDSHTMDGPYPPYTDGLTDLGHPGARVRRPSLSVATAQPSDLMMDVDGSTTVAPGITSPSALISSQSLVEMKRSPPDSTNPVYPIPGPSYPVGSSMNGHNMVTSRPGTPDSNGSRGVGGDGNDSESGDEGDMPRMGGGLDSRRNSMNVGLSRPSMLAGAKRKLGTGSGNGGDSACNPAHMLTPQLKAEVDRIFLEYLNRICSNLESTDSKGEAIHQTLMAKKMARLDESPDFRPFKFRIQAFTNGFVEELTKQGYGEDVVPIKKTKAYLWHHNPYIARFNEDGKKAKSKGNHIWNIEAKKVLPAPPDGSGQPQWIFKRFVRKIAGTPPGMAYIGLKWSWEPKIWDPQLSRSSIEVEWSSPNLPPWLSWNKNVLSGTPGPDTPDCDVTVEAKFLQDGREKKLSIKFPITVAPLSVGDNNFPKSRRPSLTLVGDSVNPRRFVSDSVVTQTVGNRSIPHLPPPPATPQETAQVMQVLTNAAQRVAQEAHTQATIMLPHTGPAQAHQQALLAKQQQVLTATAQAVSNEAHAAFGGRPGEQQPTGPSVLAAAAQAMVQQAARQVQADKTALAVLQHQMSPTPKPPPAPAPVSLSDVSIVTQSAVAHAVAITGNLSSEVEVMMTANALIQQRSRAPSLPLVPPGMGDSTRPPLASNATAPAPQPNLPMSAGMLPNSHPSHFSHPAGAGNPQSSYL
ncbi:hypothetical protein FRC03_012268 [Tulasnella sp. 419]|nr:hypothetical protein FRC03_012268 [Tulasnella sp. 419]